MGRPRHAGHSTGEEAIERAKLRFLVVLLVYADFRPDHLPRGGSCLMLARGMALHLLEVFRI
jgi:hypothetical protein